MKKVTFFALLIVFSSFTASFAAGIVCDFDASNDVTNDDLMIMFAFQKVKSDVLLGDATLDVPTVQTKARLLTGKATLVVSRLPDENDDLENSSSSTITNNDLFLFSAYQKIKSAALVDEEVSLDFPTVEKKAIDILGQTLGLGKFPGTPVGDSSFATTISGIESDL